MPEKSNTCRRCNETKEAKHFYTQKRNVSGLENICIDCKRVVRAAKAFKVSEKFVEHLYTFESCMCCGRKFKDRKTAHIHHTVNGVRGIVCFSCNYVLGKEKQEDQARISKCLDFMVRDNRLNTVNQQERPNSTDAATESSETTRCETLACKQCGRDNLQLSDFCKEKSRKHRKICRECAKKNFKFTSSFKEMRLKRTHCNCCGSAFTKTNKSCVHHSGTQVLGVVCNRCNQVLGDESEGRARQLQACLEFMI